MLQPRDSRKIREIWQVWYLIGIFLQKKKYIHINEPPLRTLYKINFSNGKLHILCNKVLRNLHRNNLPELLFKNGALKMWSKCIGEHRCWSVISVKLHRNFLEIALRGSCSPVNLHLYIFSEKLFIRTRMEGYFCLYNRRRNFCKNFLTNIKNHPS